MMSSSLTPVRHEFLAFRYVFCNSGSQPAEPKSRSAPVALQACQTACADGHYAELTPNGPPLTNSSLVGPGKFVFPISDTSLGAISPDPSNRPVETKPTTSARPVAGQTAPCLSREAWQAWWSGRRRKPPDLSPMPPAVGSQPRLFRAPQKPILRINKKQHHESRLCPLRMTARAQTLYTEVLPTERPAIAPQMTPPAPATRSLVAWRCQQTCAAPNGGLNGGLEAAPLSAGPPRPTCSARATWLGRASDGALWALRSTGVRSWVTAASPSCCQ